MNDPCAVWRERLWGVLDAATLDASTTQAESAVLLEHLRGCVPCRAALDQAVRTERLLFTAAVAVTPLPLAPQSPVRSRQSSTASHRRPTTVRRRKSRGVSFLPWAAAAVVLVIALVALLTPSSRTAADAFATVDEAIGLSAGDGRSVSIGATLTSGSELRGGPAALHLADGTRVWLDAGSHVVLSTKGTLRSGARTGVLIRLAEGAVGISAKPQDPASPLAVQTPLAEAVVIGTAFRIAHDAGGSELTVTGGTVKLVTADGERQVSIGGHVRVDAAAPSATLIASFSASSAVGTAAISKPVPGWSSSGTVNARAPSGSQSPILRQLGTGYGLCFNGVDQRLSVAIDAFDSRHGLTLLVLVIPINPGRDQRVVALTDAGHERVALVRSDLEPGAIAAVIDGSERVRLDQPKGKHWSVACRWHGDGSVVLNTSAGVGKRVAGGAPTALASPQLVFGGSLQGRALEGDIIAVELHAGVLDDGALSARVRALASANHFPITNW